MIGKANLPVAAMSYDKGVVDESLPQYIGLYSAGLSQPPAVRDIVENADLILDVGGVMLTELNTGLWGAVLDTDKAVCIHDNWVRYGTNVYRQCRHRRSTRCADQKGEARTRVRMRQLMAN